MKKTETFGQHSGRPGAVIW